MKKPLIVGTLILLVLAVFIYAFLRAVFQQEAADWARVQAELGAKAAIEARAIADRNEEMVKRYKDENLKLRDSLKNCKGR